MNSLNRKIQGTKTLVDLVTELQDLMNDHGENIPVMFAYNFGDHWGTQVAQQIRTVDIDNVEYSDYHNMCKISKDELDEEEETEEPGSETIKKVIIIS